MVQLWVNLPAHSKMTPAKYQAIESTQIQSIDLDDVGSELRVIAGQYQDTAVQLQRLVQSMFGMAKLWR
jgi:redox-sensitive bicupin YhaK (pirin superfamily)